MISPDTPNLNVKYVITEDSAEVSSPSWGSIFLKSIFCTLALITATVVIIYFCGIIDGISALEAVAEDEALIVNLNDDICLSYSTVTGSCFEVTRTEIASNGCASYVESSGGICVSFDDRDTLCIVNPNCGIVDAMELDALQTNGKSEASCGRFSILIDSCSNVPFNDITENACGKYVESSGGVCVIDDDRKTCIVNSNCDFVDVKDLLTTELKDLSNTFCERYSNKVDFCSEISIDDISNNGCTAYVEDSGGICTFRDESRTSCVVNSDCDFVDPSSIPTDGFHRREN